MAALTFSDVNKKVRYKDGMRYGSYEGRLLSLSADHQTAFVEWDSTLRKYKRESVPANLLMTVEETGTEIVGGAHSLSVLTR